MEPPVIEISTTGGIEGTPVTISLSASLTDVNVTSMEGIVIYVTGFPEGSSFNKGFSNDSVWTFAETDFGEVELTLPQYFSGDVVLMATATYSSVSRVGTVDFTVEAIPDPPVLSVGEACFDPESSSVNFTIDSSLIDQDGSETLTIIIANVPDNGYISVGLVMDNRKYLLLPEELTDIVLVLTGPFEPFIITISALSTEVMNSEMAFSNVSLLIERCDISGTTICKCK